MQKLTRDESDRSYSKIHPTLSITQRKAFRWRGNLRFSNKWEALQRHPFPGEGLVSPQAPAGPWGTEQIFSSANRLKTTRNKTFRSESVPRKASRPAAHGQYEPGREAFYSGWLLFLSRRVCGWAVPAGSCPLQPPALLASSPPCLQQPVLPSKAKASPALPASLLPGAGLSHLLPLTEETPLTQTAF